MSTLISLSQDVQRLQAALQDAQRQLQAVADAAGGLVGKLEFELGQDDSLVLVSFDAMADQLLGRTCAPFLGQPLLTLLPGLSVTELPAALLEVALRGGVIEPRSLLGEGLLSGKSFTSFAFRPAPARAVVKFWDSAGALETQALRMRAQQQLAAVFSQSPVAISLSREMDGVYVDVNEQWTLLTGLSLQDVLGRTSVDIGIWADSHQREAALASACASGRLRNLDVPFMRRDGQRLTLQLNAARIEIGHTAYFLSYLKDVSAERAMQAELLASEQLLTATNRRLNQQIRLFESMESLASVGYWTSGADPASLRWSNGLYRLAGLAPGTLMDRVTGRSCIHVDDLPQFEEARASIDGRTVEYRWQHLDGRVRWLRSRMQRWAGEDADAIDFGVVQDITDERTATLALQERLGFIQKITSRVPGMVFQLRLKNDGQFQFAYVSELVRVIYRVSPEQIMQDAAGTLKLHHPEDVHGFVASIKASARDISPWRHEYRLRFDDGEVRWLLGQAMPERELDGTVLWNGLISDITARKQSEERLRESEARFRALTELSSDWYWEQDAQFRFIRVDSRAQPALLMPVESYLGLTRWDTPVQGVSQAQWAAHRAALQAHETFHDFEMQRIDAAGRLTWAAISGTPIFDGQGQFTGYRGIGRDISERKRAEEKIERLAFYDVLTDLPNRRLLMDRLQQALVSSAREHGTGALLFIDLDNFKDLNDTQGHDVGDALLQQVAKRLLASVRETDTVARLGGDEFVVMLHGLDRDLAQATAQVEQVGKKIMEQLNQAYRLGSAEHHSTPSIGATLFGNQQQRLEELLKQADLAMYEAKAAGRNTLRFFDPTMQALVTQRTALEQELRQGLARDELVLYYQPVVDQDARIVGVEALVRWQHPQRGLVPPLEFIPMAEQTGLILPLGQWVLQMACVQLARWAAQAGTEALTIAVNVSARQFRQPEFVRQVLALLQQSGANPQRLKLELTESLLLTDTQDAIAKMTELRDAGVRFSLDDFGTGYSSLSYLKLLPLQQLKIDQSFVRDVLTDPNDAAIARTVLALGQSLGLGVVAEGVETVGQRDFLLQHGCIRFQGYLFGKPVPVEQLRLPGP
ncbi:MAG: EAL domain-containing protein [Rhodoferax sp.]|uniref:sensor domain-containing protein n=1 Tax=Rhodoferax sp. TaxID=50421 RepID=UPI0013FE9C4F|nr:EAL domain-containing protein [Rhodoferax sp.]NDP37265.1 EAL domain-containing protein [Rhodoferax sp.]